jgi:hypothetical protein
MTYKSTPNSLVSEILILDSGSTDDSKNFAISVGTVWFEQSFVGYGPQKKSASLLASNNWILNLDADEVPTPSFWSGLALFFKTHPHDRHAATVTRDFVFLGKCLRFGGASGQKKVRLFDKRSFEWDSALVHEDVRPLREQLRVGNVSGRIEHYSWNSIHDWLNVTNDRALVSAQEKLNAGKSLSVLSFNIFCRFFLEFMRSYILRFGFLDGVRGFIFCFFMAFSHELKFIKAFEILANQNVTPLHPQESNKSISY